MVSKWAAPWAAYCALMASQLIGLDKHPVVWPVDMGETWRRMMTKCMINVAGQEANEVCEAKKMCGGVEALI